MKSRAHLPGWPAQMGAELARAYLDYGEAAFRIVTAQHGVKPVDHGAGGLKWRRVDLDKIVDSLSGQPKGADSPPALPPEDLAAQALARVEKRMAGAH